jgi:hypothetical protein
MPTKKRAASATRRMVGGALKSIGGAVCPPGVWCLDTGMIILGVLIVGILAFIAYQIYCNTKKQYGKREKSEAAKPTIVVVSQPAAPMGPVVMQQPADPRFSPQPPERIYSTGPDLRGYGGGGSGAIPINQPTRGIPDDYQQLGVLTAPGGTETSGSPTRTILPLFGRKLITNRDRWNYYTRTDGLNPVQVPLEYKRRKCDDDTGCDEIMEGDSVSVPVLGQSYVANVYRYSTPRYLPF